MSHTLVGASDGMSVAARGLARHALGVMGTVVSTALPAMDDRVDVVARVWDWFREVDDRFSPFKPDSEVSRYAEGRLPEDALSADLREILGACEIARVATGGVFDIRRHRADGRPDPTGLVKGWSVDRAGDILRDAGIADFGITAGGDTLVSGRPTPASAWRIGVVNPVRPDRVAVVLEVTDLAVATSGTTERGRHIHDGRTGAIAGDELLSMTVAGPTLATADAYATAAFAMGLGGLAWVDGIPGHAACAITATGRRVSTPRFEALTAPPRVHGAAMLPRDDRPTPGGTDRAA
jgi:thiamine biosynthesis lipoprotein